MCKTRDLWFASFLLSKGFEVHDYEHIDGWKYNFCFLIPEEDWKQLKLEFQNSDVSRIKFFQEKLKDLVNN